MNLLLDTNALIWLIGTVDGDLLGSQAKEHIQNAGAVYASSASVLEIRIKTMLGKFESGAGLLDDIAAAGLKNLSFDAAHADALISFPTLSRHDPFDRMLLAQAHVEGLNFLTADASLLRLGLPLTIDACK